MQPLHFEQLEHMLDELEAFYDRSGLDQEAKDFIWTSITDFCFYQLKNRTGPFYEAADRAGLTR